MISDADFVKFIHDRKEFPQVLADKLGVNVKTVILWRKGLNLPMQNTRKSLMKLEA